MLKITVKNIAGQDVREMVLRESLFGLPSNNMLIHQVYVAMTANQRHPIAHTKDRSERSGSGIKPWRQKGTGRARVGSVRSPVWRKGGITFGPSKNRNFFKDTNVKMRQKATMIVLSEKIRAKKMIVLDALNYSEKKTKLFAETLKCFGITGKSFVLSLTDDENKLTLIARNVPKGEQTLTENLNVMQLMNCEYLIITLNGIKRLEERFAKWEKTTSISEILPNQAKKDHKK